MTLVNVNELHDLLLLTRYDATKSEYIVDGFKNGLSIGYDGDKLVKQKPQFVYWLKDGIVEQSHERGET